MAAEQPATDSASSAQPSPNDTVLTVHKPRAVGAVQPPRPGQPAQAPAWLRKHQPKRRNSK